MGTIVRKRVIAEILVWALRASLAFLVMHETAAFAAAKLNEVLRALNGM